jgi:Asp-tRNA(Asn)/Glu-tRNA(Gln) amidotransferase B subunit
VSNLVSLLNLFSYTCLLAAEVQRQIELLEGGGRVSQETRGFDEFRAQTYPLRSKEDAPDYRYMPDPNLPPLLLTEVRLVLSQSVVSLNAPPSGIYCGCSSFYATTPR